VRSPRSNQNKLLKEIGLYQIHISLIAFKDGS
jgi:hypothetical protein